jgi:hypothetical protein
MGCSVGEGQSGADVTDKRILMKPQLLTVTAHKHAYFTRITEKVLL